MKNRLFQFTSGLVMLFLFSFCQRNETTDSVAREPVSENVLKEVKTEDTLSVKKFEWQSELCEHVGYYKPGHFTVKQLQDTYFLQYTFNSVTALDTDITIDNPELYNTAYIESSLKKLENNYIQAAQKLKSLDVVPSKFWLEHKQLLLLELEELYKLQKLTLEAHINPGFLIGTVYADKCHDYVNALTSEDSTVLLEAWKNLVEFKKSQNGYPEKLEQEYQRKLKSKGRLLFARIDLMTYGWWNCANEQRKYVDGFNQEGQMSKEFNKLFNRIESVCED